MRIGFIGLLTIVLVIAKLAGAQITWFWVFSPIIAVIALVTVVMAFMAFATLLMFFMDGR